MQPNNFFHKNGRELPEELHKYIKYGNGKYDTDYNNKPNEENYDSISAAILKVMQTNQSDNDDNEDDDDDEIEEIEEDQEDEGIEEGEDQKKMNIEYNMDENGVEILSEGDLKENIEEEDKQDHLRNFLTNINPQQFEEMIRDGALEEKRPLDEIVNPYVFKDIIKQARDEIKYVKVHNLDNTPSGKQKKTNFGLAGETTNEMFRERERPQNIPKPDKKLQQMALEWYAKNGCTNPWEVHKLKGLWATHYAKKKVDEDQEENEEERSFNNVLERDRQSYAEFRTLFFHELEATNRQTLPFKLNKYYKSKTGEEFEENMAVEEMLERVREFWILDEEKQTKIGEGHKNNFNSTILI